MNSDGPANLFVTVFVIHLNPSVKDFRGPINCICYRCVFVIANIENQRNQNEGTKSICYRWNYVLSGFVRAGFNSTYHNSILLN